MANSTRRRPSKNHDARRSSSTTKPRQATRQLRDSLENTLQGLHAFRASLERSGLPEAVDSYQALQLTLQAQHDWSVQNHRIELTATWRELASEAEAIAALLRPYVNLMTAIAELERARAQATPIDSSRLASAPDTRDLAKVLLASCQVSRRHLLARGPQFLAAAERLAGQGLLQTRGWGRSRSYGSTATQRSELEEKLLHLLERSERSEANT